MASRAAYPHHESRADPSPTPDTWQVAASQSYMLQQRELASAASPDGGGLGPAKRKAEEALEGEDAKRAAS